MDFNLNQMFGGGLVPNENNMALTYLSYFFSNGIVFGGETKDDASVYMVLLGSLSVLYLAVSLMIIVFLSAQKAYLTARDKEYAGQEDKNKLFALMMVLVMAMLSPVPGHNGLSLCQYISIKLFKAGSNLADWTAIKYLNLSAMTGNGTKIVNDQHVQNNLRYYSFQRFIDASKKFNCAKALVAHNYLDPTGAVDGLTPMDLAKIYRKLRDDCGIPSTMIDDQYIALKNKLPTYLADRIKAENNRTNNNPTYVREMGCYIKEYSKLLSNDYGYIKLDRSAGELKLTPRFQNAAENKTIWQGIAFSAADCLLSEKVVYQDGLGNYVKAVNLNDADEASSTDSNPATDLVKNPQGGWVALGDHFNDSKEVGNEGGVNSGGIEVAQKIKNNILDYDIEAKTDPINPPAMLSLDPKLQLNVASVNKSFDEVLAKVTQQGWLNWNPKVGAGIDNDMSSVLRNAGGIIGFTVFLDEITKVFLPGGESFSTSILRKSGEINGLSAELRKPSAFRGMAKISAIAKSSKIFIKFRDLAFRKKDEALKKENAVGNLPWVGAVAKAALYIYAKASSLVNGVFEVVADALGSTPGKLLIWALTLVSLTEFLPKMILGYALFVWIYQCALFVFTAPLGLTIALLPKTRIGHDTWKMGLALTLKPFMYVIFFMLSVIMIDISLEFSWDILMGGYNFTGTGILEFFMELLNGTFLLKFLGFILFYLLVFIFAMTAILRGPDEVLRVLGINGTGPGSVDGFSNRIDRYNQGLDYSGSRPNSYNAGMDFDSLMKPPTRPFN